VKTNPKHIRLYRAENPYTTQDEWSEMLRYDLGFLNRAYPGVVLFPRLAAGRMGDYAQGPIKERWQSYGFHLTEITGQERDDILFDFSAHVRNWATARRIPLNAPGVTGPFVDVTLSDVLAAKDLPALDAKIEEEQRNGGVWPRATIPSA